MRKLQNNSKIINKALSQCKMLTSDLNLIHRLTLNVLALISYMYEKVKFKLV